MGSNNWRELCTCVPLRHNTSAAPARAPAIGKFGQKLHRLRNCRTQLNSTQLNSTALCTYKFYCCTHPLDTALSPFILCTLYYISYYIVHFILYYIVHLIALLDILLGAVFQLPWQLYTYHWSSSLPLQNLDTNSDFRDLGPFRHFFRFVKKKIQVVFIFSSLCFNFFRLV